MNQAETKSVPDDALYLTNYNDIMIDIRTYFDYFSSNFIIDHRTVLAALVGNSDSGPGIIVSEHNKYHPLLQDSSFLRSFGIYSMTATVQGDHYRNEVCLLPVAKYPEYTALIIALCSEGKIEIHSRYFQLVLFLPSDIAGDLPKLSTLKYELIEKVQEAKPNHSSSIDSLYRLKLDLLRYLSCRLEQ